MHGIGVRTIGGLWPKDFFEDEKITRSQPKFFRSSCFFGLRLILRLFLGLTILRIRWRWAMLLVFYQLADESSGCRAALEATLAAEESARTGNIVRIG